MLHPPHTCINRWGFYISAVTIVLILLTPFPFPLLPLQMSLDSVLFQKIVKPMFENSTTDRLQARSRGFTKQNNQENSLLIPHFSSLPLKFSDGLFLNPGLNGGEVERSGRTATLHFNPNILS